MTTVEVECSDEINTFESEIDLDYVGDLAAVTESERNRTERGVLVTYNGLRDSVCDPFFRTITSASITQEEEIAAEGSSRLLQNTRLFRFRILVQGDCRGCGAQTKLFDAAVDSENRALLEHRLLQENEDGLCSCLEEVVSETRAPTEAEYTVAYNDWLVRMQMMGNIDPEHIEKLLSTDEVTSGASRLPLGGGGATMVVGNFALLILLLLKVVL